jgi:uncharacterized UPF0146 family protein
MITDLFPVLEFTYSLMINQDKVISDIQNKKVDPRIILVEVGAGLNFDMSKEEKEITEDLIVAAINDAKEKGELASQEEMKSVTGGIPLPPGMKLPF